MSLYPNPERIGARQQHPELIPDVSNGDKIRFLESRFKEFYSKKGYEEVPPVSIYSGVDKSVNFIGSTISALKPLLDTGIPETGVFMNQPCLRTQNMRVFYDDEASIQYNSYFHTSAMLIPGHKLEEATHDAIEYLGSFPDDTEDRLVVRLSSQHQDLAAAVVNSGFTGDIKFDERDDDYYKWVFGKAGWTGRGITLAIKTQDRSQYRDIGNVVVMEKDGQPLAVEWGYGSETLLSRINDHEQPLESSVVSDVIQFKPGLSAKLSDALAATLEMYRSGVTPADKGGRFILKEYIRGVSYLRRKLGVDIDELVSSGTLYLEAAGYESEDVRSSVSSFRSWLEAYETRVESFTNAVSRYALASSSLLSKGNVDIEDLRRKNGVNSTEGYKIIDSIRKGAL